jgi:hypothetical protein
MAHQDLDFPNIVAGLPQMGGEAVPERVEPGACRDAGFLSRLLVSLPHAFIPP